MLLGGLLLALIASILLGISIGTVTVPIDEVWKVLTSHLPWSETTVSPVRNQIVWEFRTGSRFNQSPITYIGPDGKQYLAIIASSASANTAVAVDAAADDANRYRRSGSTLYVFSLPDAVAAN